MKREQKIMALLVVIVSFTVMVVFLPGMINAGSLEPSGPPGSTMRTMDEVTPTWNQIIPGSERFELCMGGAGVLDRETGLVWEQSPDTTQRNWADACLYCIRKELGGRMGWRLPTVEELASLVDRSVGSAPYLPSGHPFSNVQSSDYCSSTTIVNNTGLAWAVYFNNGTVYDGDKSDTKYVWCVRGGQGYDAY